MGETAPRGTGKVVAPLTFLRGALCLDSRYHKRRGCSELPADGWAHHAYTHRGRAVLRPAEPQRRHDRRPRAPEHRARARRARARGPPRHGHLPHRVRRPEQARPAARRELDRAGRVPLDLRAHRLPQRARRAFSQYLMRDDLRGATAATSSASAASSPACARRRSRQARLRRLPLPVVADRGRTRTTLWGLVRPARGVTRVAIDYRNRGSHAWRLLKRDRTNRRGYWTTTTRRVSGRRTGCGGPRRRDAPRRPAHPQLPRPLITTRPCGRRRQRGGSVPRRSGYWRR